MTILLSESAHVQSESASAPSLSAVLDSWLLGHALGLHSELSSPPAGLSSEEASAFRDGWACGSRSRRSRRPSLGDPNGPLPSDPLPSVAHSEEDETLWAELSHSGSHDGLPDPFAVELWAQPSREFYDAEQDIEDRDRPDLPEEAINWAMGRRLSLATIGGAL